MPPLWLSTYTEEFNCTDRRKPAQLRPSSAHRRNNPHPRPDFLLPRKLQPGFRSCPSVIQVTVPVNIGRPLFPPIRHISFHNQGPPPDSKRVRSLSAAQADQRTRESSALHLLPSSGWMHKVQMTDPSGRGSRLQPPLINAQSQKDSLRSQQKPIHTDTQPSPGDLISRLSAGSSAGYSCFHVLKPYQAGHYIIHPEFVSESRR